MKSSAIILSLAVVVALASPLKAVAATPDEADALALLKESKCTTCHSVDKKKDGPAYVAVSKKYKGDPEAVAKLTTWVSKKHTVEIDGEEEDHGMVKTRDPARIANLVKWLLSH
jgi:cytochrome c